MQGSMLWQEPVLLLDGERASVSCFSFIDIIGRSGKPVAIGGKVASFLARERRGGEVREMVCSISYAMLRSKVLYGIDLDGWEEGGRVNSKR